MLLLIKLALVLVQLRLSTSAKHGLNASVCFDDNFLTPVHQDIHFTFSHNDTDIFTRYSVQTSIIFRLAQNISPGQDEIRFLLHGRCPKWERILSNGSAFARVLPGDPRRILNRYPVQIACCHSERNTYTVRIRNATSLQPNTDYALILPTIQERTERDMVGVTRVTKYGPTHQTIVMTNFHDIFARHAFPLVDSLSTLYTMTLKLSVDNNGKLPQGEWTALANTPHTAEPTPSDYSSRRTLHWTFQKTPKMTGSLLGFTVGRFQRHTNRTRRGVEINIWTPLQPANSTELPHSVTTQYARDLAVILMDYYEEEFEIPYPLSKLDIVEVPQVHAASAVWGLCFADLGLLHIIPIGTDLEYRQYERPDEQCKVFFEDHSNMNATENKMQLAEMIAHELAHQWFGCLVTHGMWSDVYLTESFANFYGLEALRYARCIQPWMANQALMGAISYRKMSLMSDLDISLSSRTHFKRWSRDRTVALVVYHKGATMLRMLKWVIRERPFRDGVRTYLRRFMYGHVDTDDFLHVFDEACRAHDVGGWDGKVLNVSHFLRSFIYWPSHPVIIVQKINTSVVVSQVPDGTKIQPGHQQQGSDERKHQWYVPVATHLTSRPMVTYWLKPNETLSIPEDNFGFPIQAFHLYAVMDLRPKAKEAEEDGQEEDGQEEEGDAENSETLE